MIISEVMGELAAALDTIDGLRVFGWPAGTVTPPAAIVGYPESGIFDETAGRGADSLMIPVVVIVGRPAVRTTTALLSAVASGDGTSSVKAVVDNAAYTACDVVRVARWETDTITLGGTDYVAAVFDIEILGEGGS